MRSITFEMAAFGSRRKQDSFLRKTSGQAHNLRMTAERRVPGVGVLAAPSAWLLTLGARRLDPRRPNYRSPVCVFLPCDCINWYYAALLHSDKIKVWRGALHSLEARPTAIGATTQPPQIACGHAFRTSSGTISFWAGSFGSGIAATCC